MKKLKHGEVKKLLQATCAWQRAYKSRPLDVWLGLLSAMPVVSMKEITIIIITIIPFKKHVYSVSVVLIVSYLNKALQGDTIVAAILPHENQG